MKKVIRIVLGMIVGAIVLGTVTMTLAISGLCGSASADFEGITTEGDEITIKEVLNDVINDGYKDLEGIYKVNNCHLYKNMIGSKYEVVYEIDVHFLPGMDDIVTYYVLTVDSKDFTCDTGTYHCIEGNGVEKWFDKVKLDFTLGQLVF